MSAHQHSPCDHARRRVLREDRPNPRWPQTEEVESLVLKARASIAAAPERLFDFPSPVAHVVSELTDDERLAPRVVEGVLADRACRLMLGHTGLHSSAAGSKGRGR